MEPVVSPRHSHPRPTRWRPDASGFGRIGSSHMGRPAALTPGRPDGLEPGADYLSGSANTTSRSFPRGSPVAGAETLAATYCLPSFPA